MLARGPRGTGVSPYAHSSIYLSAGGSPRGSSRAPSGCGGARGVAAGQRALSIGRFSSVVHQPSEFSCRHPVEERALFRAYVHRDRGKGRVLGDYSPAGRSPNTWYTSTATLPADVGDMDESANGGITCHYIQDWRHGAPAACRTIFFPFVLFTLGTSLRARARAHTRARTPRPMGFGSLARRSCGICRF